MSEKNDVVAWSKINAILKPGNSETEGFDEISHLKSLLEEEKRANKLRESFYFENLEVGDFAIFFQNFPWKFQKFPIWTFFSLIISKLAYITP